MVPTCWKREKSILPTGIGLSQRRGEGRRSETQVLLWKVGVACKRRTINQNPLPCRLVSLKSEQTDRLSPFPLLPTPLSIASARIPILNADISRHEQSRMRDTYRSPAKGGIHGYHESSRRAIVHARSCKFPRKQREQRMAGHVPGGTKLAQIDSWTRTTRTVGVAPTYVQTWFCFSSWDNTACNLHVAETKLYITRTFIVKYELRV